MALEVGSRLGHYDVTALIGEGGMGEVYRARDTKLDRDVALKVLPQAFTDDPDRLARFEREAKVLASLNHPNIGGIHGLEEAEGTRALVLELVEGPTLADRIKQGPIPVDEALPIAKQIAEALETAHEAGVIHRDLKPANIKVKDDGTVKVLDFGLAKLRRSKQAEETDLTSTTMSTAPGVVLGTLPYMSPEQTRGRPIDKRSDIWAFGCVLYEMLTGKRAFAGEDVSETLVAILTTDIDLGQMPTEVPARLRQVLLASLRKDPKDRVRDIGDVRLAMEGAFETTLHARAESAAAPTLRFWQRPFPAATIALSIGVIAVLAAWSLTRPAPERIARFPVPLATDQSFSSINRPIVAISPDGAQIVYAANGKLWLRPVDRLQATEVPGTDGASVPFFSHDSQSIGFWADGQLRKVAVSGGAPVTLAEVPEEAPDGASWGANDMILYGSGGIKRVSGVGGIPEVVVPLERPEAAHGPQMLPGGQWVLYTLRTGGAGSWGAAQIVVESVTTAERIVLFPGRDARYLPTGHLVYTVDNVIFAVPFDVGSRDVTGGPIPLVEDVQQAGATGGAAQFSVSADGTLVYAAGTSVSEQGYSLAWLTSTGEESPAGAPLGDYANLRVSPDGTRVAADLGDGNQRDVWTWRHDQGGPTRLSFDEASDEFPLWTPDGSRIVWASGRVDGWLFWKAAAGTGEAERLFADQGYMSPWGWSADGRLLVVRGFRDIGLLTVERERTLEMLIETTFTERKPALSPDGRWLAYESNESGRFEVYVRPFPNVDDGKWLVSTDSGFGPLWSPDGTRLFYLELNNMMVVDVETDPTFNSGTPTEAFGGASYALGGGGESRDYDIAPNEERLLVRTHQATGVDEKGAFSGLIVVQSWFEELTERVPVY